MKKLSKIYMSLLLMFLYVPIFVLIVFSFNETKSRSVFSGFTLDWYVRLFNNKIIITANNRIDILDGVSELVVSNAIIRKITGERVYY